LGKGCFPVLPSLQGHIPVVVNNSAENELLAVQNRVMIETPEESLLNWRLVQNELQDRLPVSEFQLMPLGIAEEMWLGSIKDPRKKKLYQSGLNDIEEAGVLERSELRIKAFVKREKQNKTLGDEVEEFTPRLIQGGTPASNAATGPFFYQLNQHVKKVWNSDNHIHYSSGNTGEDVGAWFAKHYVEGSVMMETDYTSYDCTQREGAYNTLNSLYKKAGIEQYPNAAFAVACRDKRKAVTSKGILYSYAFQTQSGAQDTTLGNSVLNAGTIWTSLKDAGCNMEYVYIIVLGDDSFAILQPGATNLSDGKLRDKVCGFLTSLGLIPKVKLTSSLAEAEFCSGIFWPVDNYSSWEPKYVLGCKPGKMLAKIGWSMRNLSEPQVKGMLIGLSSSQGHVPLVGFYVDRCLEMMQHIAATDYVDPEDEYRIQNKGERFNMDFVGSNLMFLDRYGLELEMMQDRLGYLLGQCTSITDAINWPEFETLYLIDN
jgi:hypothetical protein